MNAVEIEQAISELAEQPFDPAEFPYAFLLAFGNKETTLKRLRSGASNKSDLGGVLQTNNIHIATCPAGQVPQTLAALRESPATKRAKAKFVLATDGTDFEAEDLNSGETVACPYTDFPDHFGFFLPLAGITTVKQIRESAFDIKATGRLIPLARIGGTEDHARAAATRVMMEAIWAPATLLPQFGAEWAQTGPDSAEVRFADAPDLAPLEITFDALGDPVDVVSQRWTDANPEKTYRLQPFGGRMLETATHQGFRIPVRVEMGNMFGTPDYAPFFLATITRADF